MATLFSATLIRDSSTAARIQAWAQFVEDTLVTTGGWVVTADTGQTLPSALAACTGISQKKGYRIYRMNDALQATAPVFMRLDFGCGGNINTAGFWVTIGGGSDGAGNITNVYWNGGLSSNPNVMNNTTGVSGAVNSYGSASTSRASIAMFVGTSSGFHVVFCIERTKNASGADTGAGLLLVYTGGVSASYIETSRYIILVGGPQPLAETALSYILTQQNPTQSFGGDIGVAVISHFKGPAQQPGLNFLVVNSADFGAESSFITNLYGSNHTYQHLNALPLQKVLVGTTISDAGSRCAIRYE